MLKCQLVNSLRKTRKLILTHVVNCCILVDGRVSGCIGADVGCGPKTQQTFFHFVSDHTFRGKLYVPAVRRPAVLSALHVPSWEETWSSCGALAAAGRAPAPHQTGRWGRAGGRKNGPSTGTDFSPTKSSFARPVQD